MQTALGMEDAAILTFKSIALIESGQLQKSIPLARRAIEVDSYYEPAYRLLIKILIHSNDFAGAVEVAKQVERVFSIELTPEMLTESGFIPLLTSREYIEWRNTRNAGSR